MNKFFYSGIFLVLTVSFNAMAASLAGKTITMTDKTHKTLIVKVGNKEYTLTPGESKIFNFESLKEGAEAGYQRSVAPYRPLELAPIALGLQRSSSKNVNVDLIPGTVWSAKIANISYAVPPKGAQSAYAPAR